MILIAFIMWNVPYLRDAIMGLKVGFNRLPSPRVALMSHLQFLVVATHEVGHIVTGLLMGGTITSVCVDPNDGGMTMICGLQRTEPRVTPEHLRFPLTMEQLHRSDKIMVTLTMGYIWSSIIGFLYIVSASREGQTR